jgi:hypothetical protein
LFRLVEELDSRRAYIRQVLISLRNSLPGAFPNWVQAEKIAAPVEGVESQSPTPCSTVERAKTLGQTT